MNTKFTTLKSFTCTGLVLVLLIGLCSCSKEQERGSFTETTSKSYVKGGGGSGDVTVPYVTNLAEGFNKLPGQVSLFNDSVSFYEDYVSAKYKKGILPGLIAERRRRRAIMSQRPEKAAGALHLAAWRKTQVRRSPCLRNA